MNTNFAFCVNDAMSEMSEGGDAAAAEDADMRKLVEVGQADPASLHAAHREAANGAVRRVCINPVILFDAGHNVGHEILAFQPPVDTQEADVQEAAAQNTSGAAQPAPEKAPPAGARGDNRGRGRGRGRGAPLTDAEKAEIAQLAELPAWKPGAGDGNSSIGPDYAPCPEMTPREGVPVGKVESFTLNADESKFYPPTGLRGRNPTRKVTVYIPAQYKPGKPAPLVVAQDAYGSNRRQLPNILDNMIHDKRLPVIIAVMIANGGGDGRGSQRGHAYDTVSGKYAEFVEAEVLARVERNTASHSARTRMRG